MEEQLNNFVDDLYSISQNKNKYLNTIEFSKFKNINVHSYKSKLRRMGTCHAELIEKVKEKGLLIKEKSPEEKLNFYIDEIYKKTKELGRFPKRYELSKHINMKEGQFLYLLHSEFYISYSELIEKVKEKYIDIRYIDSDEYMINNYIDLLYKATQKNSIIPTIYEFANLLNKNVSSLCSELNRSSIKYSSLIKKTIKKYPDMNKYDYKNKYSKHKLNEFIHLLYTESKKINRFLNVSEFSKFLQISRKTYNDIIKKIKKSLNHFALIEMVRTKYIDTKEYPTLISGRLLLPLEIRKQKLIEMYSAQCKKEKRIIPITIFNQQSDIKQCFKIENLFLFVKSVTQRYLKIL
jgi:hypothetical protein